MPDTPSSSQSYPPRRSRRTSSDSDSGSRAGLAKVIPRRPAVSWWLGIVLALGFAALVTPAITAEHWMLRFGPWSIVEHREAPFTVRAPMTGAGELRVGGGVVIARGEIATRDEAALADAIASTTPGGTGLYLAFFALSFVLGALFTHHVSRSTKGRLVRVQVVSLATIALLAVAVKIVLLSTALSALVVPIAVLAMVPTMVLDRVVGLATGVLAALVISLQAPFDIGLALLLLVQTAAAGLVIAERPRRRWLAALTAGAVTTLCTAATYLLLTYLIGGHAPELRDPLHSAWLAAAVGPAAAALLAVPVLPVYQLLVGEITQGKLIALEDLGHPLLRQIAEKSPGTWQHSLMMANMAEIAANAIGANGRLVRVGAYFHDLGKSLQPKYFIENLEAGETSPHDLLPPEVSCDAIFAHVTEGIVTARRAGLHERIVDFMHMHHGNGVLEYFWGKCKEQGNPRGFTMENFRYPGHPPQSRETAILAICDAVEAASRTLKKPDAKSIDALVQRIVYGKLHLGQLDESGLSMSDLRRISDSLRETIRHANHGRIEYPWQKAQQDASATRSSEITGTQPRLDSLDRVPRRDTAVRPVADDGDVAILLDRPSRPSGSKVESPEAHATTADFKKPEGSGTNIAILETAPQDMNQEMPRPRPRLETPPAGAKPPDEVKIAFRRRGETSNPPVNARLRTESERTAPRPRTESELAAVERTAPRPRTESELTGMPRIELPSERAPSEMLGDSSQRLPRMRTDSESGGVVDSQVRKRAATLPPLQRTRAPSVAAPPEGRAVKIVPAPAASVPGLPAMPPGAMANARGDYEVPPVPEPSAGASSSLPSVEPVVDQPPERLSGPPIPADMENAITNPPPLRRTMMPPMATRLPAYISDDMKVTAPRKSVTPSEAAAILEDAGRTDPSMVTMLPLRAPASDPSIELPEAGETLSGDPLRKAVDLATRAESVERDEWSAETPVVAPSKAELRALLGVPDVTRKQSIEEIDRLHLAAMDLSSDPEILPPPAIVDSPSGRHRPMPNTAEVDPDDIESAIEIAPPARRTAIGVVKLQKKPPPK